jgi:hypothetical protein
MKEMIKLAAETVGDGLGTDKNGKGGEQAYLIKLARIDYKTFCQVFYGRLLPLEVNTKVTEERRYHTLEEVREELTRLGLPAPEIFPPEFEGDVID